MNPIDLLKAASARPLGCHECLTPELVTPSTKKAKTAKEKEEAAAKLQSEQLQYIAELSGDEMDQFGDIWQSIKDEIEDDTQVIMDYKRAAIAFTWCDKSRQRFATDKAGIKSIMAQLKRLPATLTYRMYAIANGANAFSGLDDETKKKSMVQTPTPANDDGSGEQHSA